MRGVTEPTPDVRIIVVNFNAGPHLGRCLTALAAQTFGNFEVVVDNASTDGSLVEAVPDDPRFRAFPLGENLGFATANNRGAEGCRAAWLATLNPDAFPEPDWLERMMAAAERRPDVAMFGATLLMEGDPERLDGCGDALFAAGIPWRGGHGYRRHRLPPEGEVFSPCAAAAMYRRHAFEAVGGFDETFFCFCEDVDLGFRLRLLGHRCIQVADARVRHVGSASMGRHSAFAAFHGMRNRMWMFAKCMPGPLFWPLLPFHFVLAGGLAVHESLRGNGAAAWRGLGEALAGLPRRWPARLEIQRRRTASAGDIAAALNWSPVKLLSRAPDVRPPRA